MRVFILFVRQAMGAHQTVADRRNADSSVLSHSLKPLDIEVMKRLGTRVNLIPVIAKADTLTPQDLAVFKQRVGPRRRRQNKLMLTPLDLQIRQTIAAQHIRVYSPSDENDDDQSAEHARQLMVRHQHTPHCVADQSTRALCPSP